MWAKEGREWRRLLEPADEEEEAGDGEGEGRRGGGLGLGLPLLTAAVAAGELKVGKVGALAEEEMKAGPLAGEVQRRTSGTQTRKKVEDTMTSRTDRGEASSLSKPKQGKTVCPDSHWRPHG